MAGDSQDQITLYFGHRHGQALQLAGPMDGLFAQQSPWAADSVPSMLHPKAPKIYDVKCARGERPG